MYLSTPERRKLGQEFKQWAETLRPDRIGADIETLVGFRVWVGQLPDMDAAQVALEMARLCRLPGFDLAWFRENLIKPAPGTPSASMMVYFGLALYQRKNMDYLMRLLGWLDDPLQRENREFGLQIYLRLVEAGFTRLKCEFLWDPPDRCYPIIEATIRSAFRQNYPLVVALTREVVYLEDH